MHIRLVSIVALAALAGAGVLPAQEPSSARPDSVVPAPRTGGAHERYLMLNERVQQHQGDLDVLFLGDSITQGWEGAGREVWDRYHGSRKALNIGISGDRTQHALWRLENGNADGIKPRVTVVMIGTNNSADDRNTALEMVQGVTAVLNALRDKLPETKILLLGIFPRGEHFNSQRGKILQVNQALQKLEDGRQVFFIDFGHLFIDADGSIPRELMPDFLHLSPKGYEIWAEAIEPKLAALLAEP